MGTVRRCSHEARVSRSRCRTDIDPRMGVALDAIGAVAELAGDGKGGQVVFERSGDGLGDIQPGEGQVKHSGAHLGAEPLSVVALPQPGPGAHLPGDVEVVRADALLPDHDTGVQDSEVQRPTLWRPVAKPQPVVLDDAAGAVGGWLVGPWVVSRNPTRGK